MDVNRKDNLLTQRKNKFETSGERMKNKCIAQEKNTIFSSETPPRSPSLKDNVERMFNTTVSTKILPCTGKATCRKLQQTVDR